MGCQKYLLVGLALCIIVCIRRSPVNWVDATTLMIILGFLDNLSHVTHTSHTHKPMQRQCCNTLNSKIMERETTFKRIMTDNQAYRGEQIISPCRASHQSQPPHAAVCPRPSVRYQSWR